MITRRELIPRAVAIAGCAPAIVHSGNLMPVRSRFHVRLPARIGLYDRRYIARILPQIMALRRGGLSTYGIAAVLENESRASDPFRLVEPWSAQLVMQTIREAALLRAMDFAMRVDK
jgi:hypothetical protein